MNLVNIRNHLLATSDFVNRSVLNPNTVNAEPLVSKVSDEDLFYMVQNLTNNFFNVKYFIKTWSNKAISNNDRTRMSYRRMSIMRASLQSDFAKYSYFLKKIHKTRDIAQENIFYDKQWTFPKASDGRPAGQKNLLIIKSVKNFYGVYNKDMMITVFVKKFGGGTGYISWIEASADSAGKPSEYMKRIHGHLQLICSNETFLKRSMDDPGFVHDSEYRSGRAKLDQQFNRNLEKVQKDLKMQMCLFFPPILDADGPGPSQIANFAYNFNKSSVNHQSPKEKLFFELEELIRQSVSKNPHDPLRKNLKVYYDWCILKYQLNSVMVQVLLKSETDRNRNPKKLVESWVAGFRQLFFGGCLDDQSKNSLAKRATKIMAKILEELCNNLPSGKIKNLDSNNY